jgi:hypothetical protein
LGNATSTGTVRNALGLRAERLGALSEARLARALLHETVEVDVAHDQLRRILEALGLDEAIAVLVDQAVPVPRQIGRGLARCRPRCTRTPRGSAPIDCRRAAAGSRLWRS